MRPEDVLPTYEEHGPAYCAERDRSLWEKPLLDWLVDTAPGRDLLDIGCGGGLPIARYLVDRGIALSAIDGAMSMVKICRQNVPEAHVHLADMRGFDLHRCFDGLLAINSFFHLSARDQATAFACISKHARPGAPLVMTTGPAAGEAIGTIGGAPVYHASLSPAGYRALCKTHGWSVQDFHPEDPALRGHTVWQLRKTERT